MGDVPASLGGEEEMGRGSSIPLLKGLSLGEAIEGDVELYGIEVSAVKLQPASLGEFRGIEYLFPMFIAVPARAEEQSAHGFTKKGSRVQGAEGSRALQRCLNDH